MKNKSYWVRVQDGITSRTVEQHGPFPLEVAHAFVAQRATALIDGRSVRIEENTSKSGL